MQFTDEERTRLGAQQAAIIQIQKEMEASAQQQYDEDPDSVSVQINCTLHNKTF